MPFQARIRELSRQLENCRDDDKALKLAQELQTLLHEEIELMRAKASAVPLLTHQPK